jgi:hypothetical protein
MLEDRALLLDSPCLELLHLLSLLFKLPAQFLHLRTLKVASRSLCLAVSEFSISSERLNVGLIVLLLVDSLISNLLPIHKSR